jgi:predicted amidohydrolase YtcJ
MNHIFIRAIVLSLIGTILCLPVQAQEVTVYHGGSIITMDDDNPEVEALAVKDGKIIATGSKAEVVGKYPSAGLRNLDGKTLLPGFIDGHSHFFQAAMIADYANVSAPPVGTASDIAGVLDVLRKHVADNPPKKGDWVVGYGYDGSAYTDGRDMTREDLDGDFPDNPVALIHVSGHGVVLNSRAFEAVGISADTPTPQGGIIAREPGSKKPAGLVMETAWFGLVFPKLPKPTPEQLLKNLKVAQDHYASNGYTTAQDAPVEPKALPLYLKARDENLFFIDLFTMAEQHKFADMVKDGFAFSQDYDNHFRMGGVKIIVDGSPQGKTAYFTEPFLNGGPDGEKDYRGEFITPQDEMNELFKIAYQNNLQVFSHVNGDGAIDMLLTAHKAAGAPKGRRPVAVHCQFIRPDQIDAFVEHEILASFFTNHAFFWGDVHIENLGVERAYFLSPLKTARAAGMRMTNHSDFLVTPLNPMFILWTAVNRTSRSGRVIGPDERVSPAEGLKALTIDGAHQYFEEGKKGSLEVGKLADMVILDQNPLTIDPDKIKDIEVVETFKEGKTVYKR